jgi:hypothetical protein
MTRGPKMKCATSLEKAFVNALNSAPAGWPLDMRRQSLSWLLSLLLLLVQPGAVLHELSHLSHGTVSAGASLHPDGDALESGSCPTCNAFSQVTNAVSSAPPHVPVSIGGRLGAVDPNYAIVCVDNPTPRIRGPPQV